MCVRDCSWAGMNRSDMTIPNQQHRPWICSHTVKALAAYLDDDENEQHAGRGMITATRNSIPQRSMTNLYSAVEVKVNSSSSSWQ